MNRKAEIYDLVPILHGHGFSLRQIAAALNCSHVWVYEIQRDDGLTPKRPRTLAEAMSRLDQAVIDRINTLNKR